VTRESVPRARATPRRRSRLRAAAPWYFLIPALAFYTFVVLVPSLRGVGYSFTDWDGIAPVFQFIGGKNYAAIFSDRAAAASLLNTLLYAAAVTVIQNVLGLLLALGVNSTIKSRGVLRVVLFAPAVLTPIVTSYVWKFIFSPAGPLNGALAGVGLGNLQHDWLGDGATAPWTIIISSVWQFAGYSMVIFLAGLQGIPREIHEAAAVDGAGAVQRFWSVVRPLLAPAITINVMLSIIGNLKIFDQVLVLTNGGPGNSSESITTVIYKEAFAYGDFGYGIALAVVLTIGVAIVSAVQYRLLARNENR
jgi:raffinose/stachyose/melibiose transport system permease protein